MQKHMAASGPALDEKRLGIVRVAFVGHKTDLENVDAR